MSFFSILVEKKVDIKLSTMIQYKLFHFAKQIKAVETGDQTTISKNLSYRWSKHFAEFPWVEMIFSSLKNDDGSYRVSRNDIYNTVDATERLVKIVFWGYPNAFQDGNYLRNILKDADAITKSLGEVGSILTINDYLALFNNLKSMVSGIGVSTISKILTFWKIKAASSESVIVDSRVMECVRLFDDFYGMRTATETADGYYEMVKKINSLAKSIEATPEQVEYFLFKMGKLVRDNRHQLFNILLTAYNDEEIEGED